LEAVAGFLNFIIMPFPPYTKQTATKRISVTQQAESGLRHPWFLDKNEQNTLDFWAKILKRTLTFRLNYLKLP